MFYNTIDLSGEALAEARVKASAQAEIIEAIYKNNRGKNISPSQILAVINQYYKLNWPLTSVRRAITDLTSEGTLKKMPSKTDGIYGMPEHYWTYKTTVTQPQLF